MENRQYSHETLNRLIDDFEYKKRIKGEPFRMSGSDLLRIIKINDFEMILRRLKENEEKQTKFRELDSKILTVLSLRDFTEKLLPEIANIFRVPYAWLTVIEKSMLADLIHRMKDTETIRQRIGFIEENDFNRFVKKNSRPLVLNKYLSPLSAFFPADHTYSLRSLAVIPVCIDGRPVGSINLGDCTSTRFDPGMETSYLEQLMRAVSLCLSNVAAHESLDFLMFHDPLTGLLNRTAFEETLREEFGRSRRFQGNLSVVLINVDGFETINARYGHEYRDAALTYIGRELESLFRREDVVARLAGDDFGIILPETTTELAGYLMEMIHEHFNRNPLNCNGEMLTLSLNSGISSIEEQEITGPGDMIKKANERLHEAREEESETTVPAQPRLLRAVS